MSIGNSHLRVLPPTPAGRRYGLHIGLPASDARAGDGAVRTLSTCLAQEPSSAVACADPAHGTLMGACARPLWPLRRTRYELPGRSRDSGAPRVPARPLVLVMVIVGPTAPVSIWA